MLYVAFLSFKSSLSAEQQKAALGRRASYQFQAGCEPVAARRTDTGGFCG